MRKLIVLACGLAILGFAGAASSGSFDANTPPPNHHVHDCPFNHACGYPYLPVSFFPAILAESLAAYLQDPAECNDATDKTLLPGDPKPEANQPLRAGVCWTSTTLIHMRSIDAGDPAPDGWSGPIPSPCTAGYCTYWRLTPR